ncbi:GNAT family N-acetyltransferase [Rubellimicrobium rubrum]|uniref:GNAT family N-acetyltransferase n=1 Tax=Rubellimicrobium rubrum TaxID=2585369 RepID=A0A5C4MZ39_9RHOB|nr:GNAT family N-acetyltransferase [Rubellimicrobium rubrum]
MIAVARTDDLSACLALRRVVFIEEQAVPEDLEVDGLDPTAIHLLATDDGRPVGTARLLVKGNTGKIGRVCVLQEERGRGIGAALIRAAVEELRGLGLARAKLGSQTHAIPFYEGLGFVAEGPVYDDAGIPHRDMTRAL